MSALLEEEGGADTAVERQRCRDEMWSVGGATSGGQRVCVERHGMPRGSTAERARASAAARDAAARSMPNVTETLGRFLLKRVSHLVYTHTVRRIGVAMSRGRLHPQRRVRRKRP